MMRKFWQMCACPSRHWWQCPQFTCISALTKSPATTARTSSPTRGRGGGFCQRRNARELRTLPPVPAGAGAHLPELAHHWDRSGRGVRGICEHSGVEYLEAGRVDPGTLRSDTRSAGECRAHGAGRTDCGTDRFGDGMWADRVDGYRGCESLRKLDGFCYRDE